MTGLVEMAEGMAWSVSQQARRLLPYLSDGELVFPIASVAEDAGLAVGAAKAALRELSAIGLTDTGPLYSEDDGALRGRGTWLNRHGLAVRDFIENRQPRASASQAGEAGDD